MELRMSSVWVGIRDLSSVDNFFGEEVLVSRKKTLKEESIFETSTGLSYRTREFPGGGIY